MIFRPKIFIDMDGVIADFDSGYKSAQMHPDQFKLTIGAYAKLPVINGAKAAIVELIDAGFDVWIATKPPTENPYACTEKVLWIHEHFPNLKKKIIITFHKGLLGSEEDYLIDDRPHKAHCDEFLGEFIHYGTEQFSDWESVLNHLKKRHPF